MKFIPEEIPTLEEMVLSEAILHIRDDGNLKQAIEDYWRSKGINTSTEVSNDEFVPVPGLLSACF